jgi:hypothetical protein
MRGRMFMKNYEIVAAQMLDQDEADFAAMVRQSVAGRPPCRTVGRPVNSSAAAGVPGDAPAPPPRRAPHGLALATPCENM